MSELKVLEEEISSIEELLKVHSFHLYALRELRDKMQTGKNVDVALGSVSTEVKPRVSKSVVKKTAKKKGRGKHTTHGLYAKAAVIARKVGMIVRTENVKKLTAIRKLIAEEQLPISAESMQAMITPSYVGAETYNRAFRGTKYAKQA